MYVQTQEPETLASLSLNAGVVSRALSLTLPRFDRVTTGYSTYVEECKNTHGFGFDRDCVVFISFCDAGAVSNIWLGLGGPNDAERRALLSALRQLQTLSGLLLFDWAWGGLFLLEDQDGICRYLEARELHMKRITETNTQRRKQEADEKAKQVASKASPRRWWQVHR